MIDFVSKWFILFPSRVTVWIMEERWDEVYNFLFQGIYPSGLNKSQKLNLRRYSDKFTLDGECLKCIWINLAIDRLTKCLLLKWFCIVDGELFVGKRRAIKSKKVARKIFEEFHCTPKGCHPGILKTRAAISSRFYWKGMSIDIDNWVCLLRVFFLLSTPSPVFLLTTVVTI